jgi:hypothetical protein
LPPGAPPITTVEGFHWRRYALLPSSVEQPPGYARKAATLEPVEARIGVKRPTCWSTLAFIKAWAVL